MFWNASKVILSFGIFFVFCYATIKITEWFESGRAKEPRILKSFTVFNHGALTTDRLRKVVEDINGGMKGWKYEHVNRINLEDIVSITTTPYSDGIQFTIWYKEKLSEPTKPQYYTGFGPRIY